MRVSFARAKTFSTKILIAQSAFDAYLADMAFQLFRFRVPHRIVETAQANSVTENVSNIVINLFVSDFNASIQLSGDRTRFPSM